MNGFVKKITARLRPGFIADHSGVAAVEFAIIAPVFIMLLMAIMDFGRIYWAKSSMQFVAEQCARYAMVNPNITNAAMEAYALTETAAVGLSGATFTATRDDSGTINYMEITGSYTYNFLTPLVGTTLTLGAKAKTAVSEDS